MQNLKCLLLSFCLCNILPVHETWAACFPNGQLDYPNQLVESWTERPNTSCSATSATPDGLHHVQPFWVDTPGRYHFESSTAGLILYRDSFDPLAPLDQCLLGGTQNPFTFLNYISAVLEPHRQYFLVSADVFQTLSNPRIWGPGQSSLGLVPALGSNLSVTATEQLEVELGRPATLSITATNHGSEAQDSVIVEQRFPGGWSHQSDTCGGSVNNGTWTWSLGTLEGGAQQTCELTIALDRCVTTTTAFRISGQSPESVEDNRAQVRLKPFAFRPVQDGEFNLGAPSIHWLQSPAAGLLSTHAPQSLASGPAAKDPDNRFYRIRGDHSLKQEVVIPAQDNAQLSFWQVSEPTFEMSDEPMQILIDGQVLATFWPLRFDFWADNFVEHCFRKFSYNISGYADGQSHTVEIRHRDSSLAGIPTDFKIDDVQVEVCADVSGDLSLQSQLSESQPSVGQELTVTHTVQNLGPGDQTGVEIFQPWHPALTYVSDNCAGRVEDGRWIGTIGDLIDGATSDCTVRAIYSDCRSIQAVAEVQGSLFDLEGNNTAQVEISPTVEGQTDGSFESGSSQWILQNAHRCGPNQCGPSPDHAPRSGNFYVRLNQNVNDSGIPSLEQVVHLPSADRGLLEVWLWSPPPFGAGSDTFNIHIDDQLVFQTQAGLAPYADGYAPVVVDVTPWADGQDHTLRLTAPAHQIFNLSVDDLSISACNRFLQPCAADPLSPDVDQDGVRSACDQCPGFDDRIDWDADGIPDGCDICPLGDNAPDLDNDGIPDACDRCQDLDGDNLCQGLDCNDQDPQNRCSLFANGFETGGISPWGLHTP